MFDKDWKENNVNNIITFVDQKFANRLPVNVFVQIAYIIQKTIFRRLQTVLRANNSVTKMQKKQTEIILQRVIKLLAIPRQLNLRHSIS